MLSLIYFKPTNYCNVGCKHCYLTGKQRSEFYFMSKKNIDLIYEKLEKYFVKYNIPLRPNIVLHGGEPLLVDYDILEYIFSKFKFYGISVQTSLVPLFDKSYKERKKYYELFKKYNIGLSTSYDFFGIRIYKGSYELFDKKYIEIINEVNKLNLKPYMMFTITKKMQGKEKEVYDWLLKYSDLFKKISYEEYNEYHNFNKFLYLTNKEISEILIKFYQYDKENNYKVFEFYKILTEKMKKTENLPGKFCTNCQESYLVIDPEGEITNCPDKAGMESFGNIYKQDLEEILKNKTRYKWIISEKKSLGICYICEFKNICNGGCPLKKNLFIKNNIKDKENCSGFYPFLKYIKDSIN